MHYSSGKEEMDKMKPEAIPSHHDVTVIGAGWSGLTACKYMLEEGLSVVVLEKKQEIGGVWVYSDDPNVTSVMKSTTTTSSSTVTEMSDFPMPEEIGIFPHHTQIVQYLHSYAENFNLNPHIKLNTEVKKVEKENDEWKIESSKGEIYTSKFLVVATGLHQEPNRQLEATTFEGFTGKIYHASEIKEPIEKHKGQRLLVVGGGETGSDICTEWYNHAKFTYWSIPRGQHFFRKYAKVVPWGKPQALDKASSRMMKNVAPYDKGKPGLSWACKWTTNGSLLAYQGHGIPEWKNNAAFFHFFINKSAKVLDLVDYKKLVPKGGIAKCEGKEVTFADGSKEEFDLIIMSTGYNVRFPALPKRYADVAIRNRHKFVFDVEDPSIAFVGLVRPVVGSLVGISELQSRWVAKVFSKHVPLKPLQQRREEVKKDIAHWSKQFKDSSQRIGGLVEGYTYVDDIARNAQVYPDYWKLLKENPKQWFVAAFAPFNTAMYRLNEPKHRDQAIATMESHRKSTLSPVHLLLLLFLRMIWFDWWLNRISSLKYRIQVSSWWPTVRSWRVTQSLDYAWTRPKSYLFDNQSTYKNTYGHKQQQQQHLKCNGCQQDTQVEKE